MLNKQQTIYQYGKTMKANVEEKLGDA